MGTTHVIYYKKIWIPYFFSTIVEKKYSPYFITSLWICFLYIHFIVQYWDIPPPPNLLVCRKFENIRTKELVRTKNINTQKFAVTEVGTNTENVK